MATGAGRSSAICRAPRAQRGVEAVRRVARAAQDIGLEALTLYAFSTENWRRREDEISALMGLMKRFILSDLEEFKANNVRLRIIGDYSALSRPMWRHWSTRRWPKLRPTPA